MEPSSSTAVPVSNKSEEFRRVQYLLQLSLRDFELGELCIWHFSNPTQALEFEKRTRNLPTQHAWVDANRLGEGNTLESLHAKGFNFPQTGEGMQFNCGNIDLKKHFHSGIGIGGGVSGGGAYRYLLCQVGVGRSYVVDEPSEQLRLPPGYDSVYLAHPQEDQALLANGAVASDGQQQQHAAATPNYHHEYVVFDPAQTLPMYLVQFFADPLSEEARAAKKASALQGYGANASFDINEMNGPMNPSIQQLYDRYDFFDPVLYVPVSVRDKMVGSHSSGEAAQHKLIGIGDAYDAALSESVKQDSSIAQRQAEIRSQLRSVDGKLREVNKNSAEVEEKIYQMLQKALFQLQDATQEKMSALLAEEVELRRQLQQIDWMETFLELQRNGASQVDFLNAWKCHVQLRADLTKDQLRTPAVLDGIHADLALNGGIEITKARGPALMGHPSDQANGQTRGLPAPPVNFPGPPPPAPAQIAGPSSGEQAPAPQPQPQPAAGLPKSFENMTINTAASPLHANIPELPQSTNVSQFGAGSFKSTQSKPTFTSFSPGSDGNTSASRSTPSIGSPASGGFLSPTSFGEPVHIPGFDEGATTPVEPPSNPSTATGNKSLSSRTPMRFGQYSLSAEAKRRARQLKMTTKEMSYIAETVFENSRILSQEPFDEIDVAAQEKDEVDVDKIDTQLKIVSEAQALYLCLPSLSSSSGPPKTNLLYATWKSKAEKSVEAILDAMPTVQIKGRDGTVQSVVEPTPTVMIIKSNGRVFGGYVNDSWGHDGSCFGNARCFLFSISLDIKIPFHGRTPLPGPDPSQYELSFEAVPTYSAAKSGNGVMQFGVKDLVLQGSLINCSSELEFSYGVGTKRGSEDAKTLLAGSETFQVDELELWAVQY